MAMDAGGDWFAYENKPDVRSSNDDWFAKAASHTYLVGPEIPKFSGEKPDWKDSLLKRP